MPKIPRAAIAGLTLAAGSLAGYQGDTLPRVPDAYTNTAHTFTLDCMDRAGDNFPLSIEDAQYDYNLAVGASKPTIQDTESRIAHESPEIDLSGYPFLDRFLRGRVQKTGRYLLPMSGIEIQLTQVENDWTFNPEALDSALEAIFLSESDEAPNAMQDFSYDCLHWELYDQRSLEGSTIAVYVIGENQYCLLREQVFPRHEYCPGFTGNTNNRRIIVAPRSEESGSEVLSHEILHKLQRLLGIIPKSKLAREFFAYSGDNIARDYMAENDSWAFSSS